MLYIVSNQFRISEVMSLPFFDNSRRNGNENVSDRTASSLVRLRSQIRNLSEEVAGAHVAFLLEVESESFPLSYLSYYTISRWEVFFCMQDF